MKYSLITFFILINLKCFSHDHLSDSIKYSLYVYYGCDHQFKKIKEYSIEDRTSDSITEYKPDSLGICLIPKDLDATLVLRAPLVYNSLVLDFTKEIIIDTIIVPPIYKAPIRTGFYIGPTYFQYYICGKQCTGFQKTFWKDGQLWQKGHFKHGDLKCLKTYYQNGTLELKIKERFLSGCDITYDKSGKLTLKLSYFLFFSHYKIYDLENRKYINNISFGRYKNK